MAKRPPELIYAVDEMPPLHRLILLGMQQAVLIAIYLILIVIIVKASGASTGVSLNAVCMGLIALAIGAALQAIWVGPIGSGFLAAPVITAIYLEPSIEAAKISLGTVFGMTIFAGMIEILMSQVLQRFRFMFPPVVSGLVILVVGTQLGIIGVEQALETDPIEQISHTAKLVVSFVTLATMIFCSVWMSGMVRLISSFLGLAVGFILSLILGVIPEHSLSQYSALPWVHIPNPDYITYDFSSILVVPFLISSLAAALRTIGAITTCQKINDLDWKRPDMRSIKGGVLADGLSTTIAGFIGSPGMNTAPSLIGVSKAVGATSRYIAFSAAMVLIISACLPKIIGLILILPMAVVGPALIFNGSFMFVGGLQIINSRNIDTRATFIVGVSFLLGLTREVIPQFFQTLPAFIQHFTGSMLSITMISAMLLNLLFRIRIHKKAKLKVKEPDTATLEIKNFLTDQGQALHLDADLTSRSIKTTLELVNHIFSMNLNSGDLNISSSYDEIDFIITVEYPGKLLALPYVGQKQDAFLEEESSIYGLSDFLIGVYPDHLSHRVDGDHVTIKLTFNV